jgi:NTE family protein
MSKKHKIGLALSGGGVKGFAHAGAIKAMEEKNIHPDIISGTSAGAIVGALYSAGYSPDEICSLFKQKDFNDFVEITLPKSGLFATEGFLKFLRQSIEYENLEELPIPLVVTSTNLDKGVSVTFDNGNIAERVMASACIPVIFKPVIIDGNKYVDGGIFKNFPVSPIRDSCQFVIGVNASPLTTEKYSDNIVAIAERSYHFMFKANTLGDKAMCDIVVEVENVMQYKIFDLKKVDIIFEQGYLAMKKALENNNKIPTKAV